MADIRESFPTLEDGSQAGTALRSVQQGDSVDSKNGSLGFAFKDNSGNAIAPIGGVAAGAAPTTAIPVLAFKDSSGNLVLPQLNASGQLPVSSDISGDNLKARGLLVGTGTLTTVASITLIASKTYQNIEFSVACFRDSIFELIFSNNGVETILADVLVGSGQYSVFMAFENMEFTAGSTGTQLLLVKGQNLTALSDMRSSIACKQLS